MRTLKQHILMLSIIALSTMGANAQVGLQVLKGTGNNAGHVGGYTWIGNPNSLYLSLDNNEIQARNGNNASILYLNYYGGNINLVDNVSNPDGKVGIGTNNPLQKLDVIGSTYISEQLGIGVSTPANNVSLHIKDEFEAIRLDGEEPFISFYDGADYRGYLWMTNSDDMFLYNRKNANLLFGTNNSARMTITGDGDVGIGTTIPNTKLHIIGNENNGTTAGLRIQTSSNTGQNMYIDGNEIDAVQDGLNLNLNLNTSQKVTIAGGGGNVGIRDLSPDFTLDIDHPLDPPTGMDGAGFSLRNTGGNNNDWRLYTDNNTGRLAFYENGNLAAAINESGAYSNLSDRRLKTDINYLGSEELEKIMQLKPASYKFKKLAKSDRRNYGLIAQELQKVYPDLVQESGDSGDGKGYLGVSYSELIPILIVGIQEQQAIIEQKDAQIEDLNSRVEKLEQLMAQLVDNKENSQSIDLNATPQPASLEQNEPNPFSTNTTINYSVPNDAENAQIIITDLSGNVLKTVEVNGTGTLNLEAHTLSSGTYTYSLVVDAAIVATNKMILTK